MEEKREDSVFSIFPLPQVRKETMSFVNFFFGKRNPLKQTLNT